MRGAVLFGSMPEKMIWVLLAPEGPLGLDVVSFSNAYHRRAHDAGYLGDEHDAYRQHRVDQARAENAHDYDSEKDAREGQESRP